MCYIKRSILFLCGGNSKLSTITNGQFVESMLDRIVDFYNGNENDFKEILFMLRAHYAKFLQTPVVLPFAVRLVNKIDQRVKDVFYTIDPMWFVIALKVRYEGGSWDDMLKYGVKKIHNNK